MSSRGTAVLAMVAAVSLSTPLHAEENKDREKARGHFRRGQEHFDLGEFQEAVAQYREAYRLFPSPAFLYNIAQSYRFAGNHERAIFHYQAFLRKTVDPEQHAAVEQILRDLDQEEQQGAEKPPMAQVPAEPGEAAPSGPTVTVVPSGPPPMLDERAPATTTQGSLSASSASSSDDPLYKKWWVWAGAGAVVLTTIVVAAVASSGGGGGSVERPELSVDWSQRSIP